MAQPVFESVTPMSQEEFAAWVPLQGLPGSCELLNGRVVMTPPAGYPHGSIESRINRRLADHVEQYRLGEVFGSSQGFELPSGDTVEADVTFVTSERWAKVTPEAGKFLRVAPDLVVEILSASTASRDRGEKKAIYERNGVREYWLVDSNTRSVTVHLLVDGRFDRGRTHEADERLTAATVPALVIDVAELFLDA